MIAFVAQWLIVVPALLVIITIARRRIWGPDMMEALIAGLLCVVLVKIAGRVFNEARPFVLLHVRPLVAHAPDNAFPSDHLAACGLAFAYLWPRNTYFAIATLLIAGTIAYARVAAHLHWPIDVVTGFALGALAAGVTQLSTRWIGKTALPKK